MTIHSMLTRIKRAVADGLQRRIVALGDFVIVFGGVLLGEGIARHFSPTGTVGMTTYFHIVSVIAMAYMFWHLVLTLRIPTGAMVAMTAFAGVCFVAAAAVGYGTATGVNHDHYRGAAEFLVMGNIFLMPLLFGWARRERVIRTTPASGAS